jgi:hypothetical protein
MSHDAHVHAQGSTHEDSGGQKSILKPCGHKKKRCLSKTRGFSPKILQNTLALCTSWTPKGYSHPPVGLGSLCPWT